MIVCIFGRCDFTFNICSRFKNRWAQRISADLLFGMPMPLLVQCVRLKVGCVRAMEAELLTLLVKIFFQSRFLQRGPHIAAILQLVVVSDLILAAAVIIDVIITVVFVSL